MSTDLPRAFHLPRNVPEPPLETRQFHKLTALVPKLDPDFIKLVCARLKENRRALLKRTTADIVLALDRAVAPHLASSFATTPQFEQIVRWTTGSTGWDGLYGNGLFHTLKWITAKDLTVWLQSEVYPPSALGRQGRGPGLIFHVLAGAIPYPSVVTMVSALLARSGSLIKSSSADPMFPAWFAGLLSTVDPELGDCLAVLPWPGGNTELEDAALGASSLVVGYGTDDTVATLRQRTPPGVRFLGHPNKFSIGVSFAGADAVADPGVSAARDVMLFDLSGCLSPQVFFVVGGLDEFVSSMERRLRRDPVRPFLRNPNLNPTLDRTPADIGSIRRSREKAEFAELSGRGVRLLASENLDWTIVVQERPLRPFQLFNRVVNVVGIDDYREIAVLLGESAKSLSCVGVSVTPDRRDEVVDFLVELGAKRICKLGEMQTPPLAWHHDGRFHLADFLEWTDVEI